MVLDFPEGTLKKLRSHLELILEKPARKLKKIVKNIKIQGWTFNLSTGDHYLLPQEKKYKNLSTPQAWRIGYFEEVTEVASQLDEWHSCTKVCRKTRCAHFGYKQNATRNDDVTRCVWLLDVWKWGNRLTLGFSAAENTNYMKKRFKYKLFRIKFPTSAYVYLSVLHRIEIRGSEDWYGWNIIMNKKWQITFTLVLSSVKNTAYMKKSFK